MDGRLAPTQRVIVHARHIVVDERKRVNALDGCANLRTPRGIGIHRLACRNHQQGSNALAAAEQSVGHGLMENRISSSGRSGC
jgi:hypothetical protein